MSVTYAYSYSEDGVGSPPEPSPTPAASDVGWGAVSVGEAFAFTPTAAYPPFSAVQASAYVYGGFYGGTYDTPLELSALVVQGPNVTPPAPSGEQLSFFWSTG